jgi:hypothetical protein
MRLPVTTVYPRFIRLIISHPDGGYTVTLSPQGVGIAPTRITSYQGTVLEMFDIPCVRLVANPWVFLLISGERFAPCLKARRF